MGRTAYLEGNPKIPRLFPDVESAEKQYFKNTGMFPIMHVVGVRTDSINENPWLPIGRKGHTRDEYGAAIAFLLSDEAGYITGVSLPIDGGYLAT